MCDKLNWMKNGWMDWIEWMWKVDMESGKWRGSGSHTKKNTYLYFAVFIYSAFLDLSKDDSYVFK